MLIKQSIEYCGGDSIHSVVKRAIYVDRPEKFCTKTGKENLSALAAVPG